MTTKTLEMSRGQILGLGLVLAFLAFESACRPSTSHTNRTDREVSPKTHAVKDKSDQLFANTSIPKIVLELSAEQERKLTEDARQYVKCNLIENGKQKLVDVGIKLKGAAGSFQDLAGKPAFTVNVSKFRKGQSFHDLDKFHLNNSVQDELYTNEWLCSSICRDASIPAPRVTHARVWLNDRDLGLYVLKESFDRKFLQRQFVAADGNLYDGGFCQDIDVDLQKDAGDGPRDFSDLRELQAACAEQDPMKRKEQMSKHLDLVAFKTFMAFEMMACHWDGYVANANNYRVYFPPNTKLAFFLPHGMDQMFQDPGFQTFGHTPSIVANAYRGIPEWNDEFRKRVAELLPLFDGNRLEERVRAVQKKLRGELSGLHPGGSAGVDEQFNELIQRLHERARQIAQHLTEPDPPIPDPEAENLQNLLEIGVGETVPLSELLPKQETDQSKLDIVEVNESQTVYSIQVGEADDCIASWRKLVQLPRGSFRFSAELCVQDVVERNQDDRGRGAGLRISGSSRENGLVKTTDWTRVSYDFQTNDDQQVIQLVAELRAIRGSMQVKNLSVTRVDP